MWAINRQELALPIHKMNTTQLTTVLGCRGFTLTPDRDLVIRIPSDVHATRMQVISTLRKALLASFIPQMICDHVLRSTRVVRLAARAIGSVLITTKRWITKLYTAPLPCNCHLYPPEWPRRHGHNNYLCPLMVIIMRDQESRLCTSRYSLPSSQAPVVRG